MLPDGRTKQLQLCNTTEKNAIYLFIHLFIQQKDHRKLI